MSPSSGGGTVTPIIAGVPGPTGSGWIRPLPYTLLSLGRYAQIMGIAPAHFMRGTAESLATPVFPLSGCSNLWPRHEWQNIDQVSHEGLALAIQSAEHDIARAVGYWPAPMWLPDESHEYPRSFAVGYYDGGVDVYGRAKSVQTRYGKVVSYGRRAVSLVGTATVAGGALSYLDLDGDLLFETAKIVLPTALTNACEIKVYTAGFLGEPEWEIRPVRSVEISGGNVTIYLDAWFLIQPELLGAFPTSDGFRAIDISTTANYVVSVDVYREYADTTQYSSLFTWDGDLTCACAGSGCPACSPTTQTGCTYSRNDEVGLAVPTPATYDSAWAVSSWAGCVEPKQVRLWYYAGERSERYLRGATCDPLSDWWAQTIAWIATARLERPLCGCSNVQAVAEHLSIDLATRQGGASHSISYPMLNNPLGTRRGEVMSWKRISKLTRKSPRYASV